MRVLFMGTPDFAVPVLRSLMTAHEVTAAVTQPDRPKGRGKALAFSPVKACALEASVPVFQPDTLRNTDVQETLRQSGADVFVVAAYGLFLPGRVLKMPPLGCVNVHASLLPKYRGAAPMQYALLNGDSTTGITIMHMAKGIDTGDIILRRELDIKPGERLPSLHDRMAALGGECILEALAQLESGTAARTPQDDALSSYAPMINKEDGHINWRETNNQIINRLRALDPWPGLFTLYEGQNIKIWDFQPAEPDELTTETPMIRSDLSTAFASLPGTVIAVEAARGLLIKTGDGALWATEVQAVGGKRMRASDYLRGHGIQTGIVLN